MIKWRVSFVNGHVAVFPTTREEDVHDPPRHPGFKVREVLQRELSGLQKPAPLHNRASVCGQAAAAELRKSGVSTI